MSAKILVIDDNSTNLKLVSELLEFEGHKILKAVDAEEAQVVLADTLPELILMDIALPGMDGLTLTRKLKAAERTRHIHIVALTAFAMKGDDQKAFDAGCAGYITKPIDTRKLPGQVAELLAKERPWTSSDVLATAIREVQKGNTFFSPAIAKRLQGRDQKSLDPKFDSAEILTHRHAMKLLCFILFVGTMLIAPVGEARPLPSKWAEETPRIRMGALPIPNLTFLVPMPFAHPKRLGWHRHRSIFGIGEATGILYTRRGGFIDLAHTRNSADWTATLAARIEAAIRRGDTAIEFKVIGPSVFSISFDIPAEWDSLSTDARREQERDLSIRIAQYGSYVACVWHETITWYGFSIIPWVSERCSSFSYEETYSDALGIQLAGQALRDPERPYNAAMTHALNEEIERLGGLRKCQARRVGKLVDRRWWSSCTMWPLNRKLSRRNLDIGLNDGDIAPWLVLADDNPVAVPVPPLPANVTMTITPHLETWPSRAFPDADPKTARINVGRDLERLIDVLRQDVRNELGPNADKQN